uniref:Uncharacterized protein n=1 Tax=Anguilla anguilla TaxID=7936 RepID=A0A0E9P776_ANGAN
MFIIWGLSSHFLFYNIAVPLVTCRLPALHL